VIEPNELNTTLLDLVGALSQANVSYHLTGGFASSFYGEPRFTQDIDIVIKISEGTLLDNLILCLSNNFLLDDLAIKDAVKNRRMFQALHEETMIKVDFHVGEAVPGELKRSSIEEILSGLVVPLVSKEDAILSKLLWIKKGSHKSRQDVKMMLLRPEKIDINYLNEQANVLDVSDILREVTDEDI